MAKFSTTQTFADGDQVTSTKLNGIVGGLAPESDLVADATLVVTAGKQLKAGVMQEANIGANSVNENAYKDESIPAEAFKDDSIPERAIPDDTIPADKLTATVPWTKLLPADKATQADMQSETSAHFVSPDVLKYHPGVAKAGGIVAVESGSAALTGAYNITSATESGNDRVIVLAVTMANTNYRVELGYEDSSPVASIPVVNTKTTTGFTISPGGEASGRKISFNVYGQLQA